MIKLIEVKQKNFGFTMAENLHGIKNQLSEYINEIKNPELLDNFWNELDKCPATVEAAENIQTKLYDVIDKCEINNDTMFGFLFQSIIGSIGLLITKLKEDNE